MSSKQRSQGPLAQVKAACKALRLDRIPLTAWDALREAQCELRLDLEVDIEHVTVKRLEGLAAALEPLAGCPADIAGNLWEWLALPASGTNEGNLSSSRALLILLAQASGSPGELLNAAGGAYLALLGCEGADQQWSLLFQPVIFRQIIRTLRSLRRGDLKQKKEKADGEEGAAATQHEQDEGGEEESAVLSSEHALALLDKVVAFLSATGLSASVEASSYTVEELSMLVLKPATDAIGRAASAGLAGLVARGGTSDEIRRLITAAIRAVMPAVLMTQERQTSPGAAPKPLQQARAIALKLICGLIRDHPQALTPRPAPVLQEELGDGEPAKKRSRRGAKGGQDEGDDECEEDAEDVAGHVGVDKDAQAAHTAEDDKGTEGDGEKKARRRRPKDIPCMEDPVVALLELLCVSTPERAEWRGYSVDSIIALLCEAADVERKVLLAARSAHLSRRLHEKTKDPTSGEPESQSGLALPIADEEDSITNGIVVDAGLSAGPAEPQDTCNRFLAFLQRILESERVAVRVLATEVAVHCLERSGRLARGGAEAARTEVVQRLLMALVRRCSDSVPTVRGCALGGVSTALQSLAKCGESTALMWRSAVVDRGHPQHIDLPGLFRMAAMDEKPTARRSALGLLDTVLPVLRSQLQLDDCALAKFFDLRLLNNLSADESISVRKASICSMALLMRTCPVPQVQELWVRNVLPLVLDVEASVAERALDELEASIVNPLGEQAPRGKAVDTCVGGKDMLSFTMPLVLEGLDTEAMEYLQRGLKQVAKRNEGKMPRDFVKTLAGIVKECLQKPLPLSGWPQAVWAMLEEVSASTASQALNFDLLLDAWVHFRNAETTLGQQAPASLGSRILRTLESLVPIASQERMSELMDSLCAALASFTAPTSLIRAMMSTINTVEATWKTKKMFAEKAKQRAAWRSSFLKSIQATLVEAVRADGPIKETTEHSAQILSSGLFALGELALLDIGIINDGIITQVQTLATNTVYQNGVRIDTSPSVRGQALVALGKCCLKKETLAKKTIELLVIHLRTSEHLVVRNNVLIVLGDLCIHYTSLVDRFVPCLTDLLRDNHQLLRKQAAMTLASLLSEDFIKLRGSVLFRFLYTLSDPCEPVRNFVECVFARILHQRNSAMFAQNFLDVICALNGWCGLANFKGAEGNEDFSLIKLPARRATVYRFMLTLMSSDQKFNVCAQIVTTLLAAFVDAEEAVPLPKAIDEPAGQALSDGLTLLCCKEMRICFTTQRSGQDDEVEGGPAEKAGADAARGVLSSILKRNMCENIVPVLVQMKTLMESRHSPFLRQLRHCLREILRDFKDDLQDMLAGDQQLAAEIAFDLQKEDAAKNGQEEHALLRRPMLPHLGGASRRQSLGTMMRPPHLGPSTPITDGAATQICAAASPSCKSQRGATSSPVSTIPKSRRSLEGQQPSNTKASFTVFESEQIDRPASPARPKRLNRKTAAGTDEAVGEPPLPPPASPPPVAPIQQQGSNRKAFILSQEPEIDESPAASPAVTAGRGGIDRSKKWRVSLTPQHQREASTEALKRKMVDSEKMSVAEAPEAKRGRSRARKGVEPMMQPPMAGA